MGMILPISHHQSLPHNLAEGLEQATFHVGLSVVRSIYRSIGHRFSGDASVGLFESSSDSILNELFQGRLTPFA